MHQAGRLGPSPSVSGAVRFDTTSMVLHWITAAAIIAQFLLAEFWEDAALPTRQAMVTAHMTLGLLLTATILVRIVWRMRKGRRLPPVEGLAGLASSAVQTLLYLLIVIQTAAGFAARWSAGKAITFFGLGIPSPIGALSKGAHHLIVEGHDLLAWAIVLIATGHALAALYHHFVLRDGVLRRMLPGASG